MNRFIEIKNAKTNNLKRISLKIPHQKLVVITGVSGSGKSSLAFDIIAKEGQRRFFETLPSFARQFMGQIKPAEVESITGLSPVITISQNKTGLSQLSTVGTIADLYSYLRLIFARFGQTKENISLKKSMFSFNSQDGKCLSCNGSGLIEEIDIDKLITDPNLSIRQGVLAPTLPTGYIMYSQVRMEVLKKLCEVEGFSIDTPWKNLSEENKNVILYGSQKIKVEFGKHSLESRLKWTGIKPKPPEEGYYRGMIPMMSEILKRDRNPNILKYAQSVTCASCNGERLNESARNVKFNGKNISYYANLSINDLLYELQSLKWTTQQKTLLETFCKPLAILSKIGLGYLSLNRSAKELTGSEIQRIKLCNQVCAELSDTLYIFDEPSIGLHHRENESIIQQLRNLVNQGNTVIVVEHDIATIKAADWIIEIGPEAGINGGEVLFSGSLSAFLKGKKNSPTLEAITTDLVREKPVKTFPNTIELLSCSHNNLKSINVSFKRGALNIVTGKSGSGRSSLVIETLKKGFEQGINNVDVKTIEGLQSFKKLIFVDQSPIGKTPRSNPATYLQIADEIRDLFARQESAKAAQFKKSRFSFNNKGGRCETCQGAGKTQIGMHFLGKVDVICKDCGGKRFNEATLQILYQGKSIADVYNLSIWEALEFFKEEKKILTGLKILSEIGLGYLKLGQSSSTLSGGEAQRIKLAYHLMQKHTGCNLYILNEPSVGLHRHDLKNLLQLFNRLNDNGNTIICIEQDEYLLKQADWVIELGPENGENGGNIIYQGQNYEPNTKSIIKHEKKEFAKNLIQISGIKTNHLKNIDVNIEKHQITAITGLSGSGKSSLLIDTIGAESKSRFFSSLSTYQRSFIQLENHAQFSSIDGLGPCITLMRSKQTKHPRSTVATSSGIYEHLRLLYSRIAQDKKIDLSAQHFSFNHALGACAECNGNGFIQSPNAKAFIENENLKIPACFINHKNLNYYTDQSGQFMATLKVAAEKNDIDLNQPWRTLKANEKAFILYGDLDQVYTLDWNYKTKTKSGTQKIKAPWKGFCNYIQQEYEQKLLHKNIQALLDLTHETVCNSCQGQRLKPLQRSITFEGINIGSLVNKSVDELIEFLNLIPEQPTFIKLCLKPISTHLEALHKLGLGHLNLDRRIDTLSGGEYQRLSIAGGLSAQLYGVTYLVDEPSIGLDKTNAIQVMNMLKQIVKQGNTVIIIEHDPDCIQLADNIIELGPAGGINGGNVVYQGKLNDLPKHTKTYQSIHNNYKAKPIKNVLSDRIQIKGAHANFLQHIDIELSTKAINVISGVSGSGKSSLIHDVIYKSFSKRKFQECKFISNINYFENTIFINQQAITTAGSSSLASFTGILKDLQSIFAKIPGHNFKPSDFSHNSKKGKCNTCNGYGQTKIALDYVSDIWTTCTNCDGLRYNDEILGIKHNKLSIGNYLQLSIEEASAIFNQGKISQKLNQLIILGLGHIHLGHNLKHLSSGELQRIKLAKFLFEVKKENTLILMDEPSAGLHHEDLLKLVDLFTMLIEKGHTLVITEHNPILLNVAHHCIYLGPGSGKNGGQLL